MTGNQTKLEKYCSEAGIILLFICNDQIIERFCNIHARLISARAIYGGILIPIIIHSLIKDNMTKYFPAFRCGAYSLTNLSSLSHSSLGPTLPRSRLYATLLLRHDSIMEKWKNRRMREPKTESLGCTYLNILNEPFCFRRNPLFWKFRK